MAAATDYQDTAAVDLGALLDAGDGAVVVLVAGETRLAAHRAVLAAGSPVFGAMFRHDMQEASSGEVTIQDVEGPVLRQLLAYLYTGRAQQVPSMSPQLLAAADKYGVWQLKDVCEKRVASQLDVENAAAAAMLAVRHSCHSLRKAAVAFIRAHTYEVMATKGWEDAVHHHPTHVVEVSRLLAEPLPETSVPATTVSSSSPTTALISTPTAITQHQSNVTHPPDDAAVSLLSNLPGKERGRMLIKAAKEGAVKYARVLITVGTDMEANDEEGLTALHWAAEGGHVEIVQCLLQSGARVGDRTSILDTPLHWAAVGGCLGVVRLLLEASADPNARNEYGCTPLHLAAKCGHTEVVAALLEVGADKRATTNRGDTPLDRATQKNHEHLFHMLQ